MILDGRLQEAVALAVSAMIKGSWFDPGDTPDMLTGLQLLELEKAVGRAPLSRDELLEAADEYARQLDAAKELITGDHEEDHAAPSHG